MDWLDLQRLLTSLVMPLPFGLGLAALGALLGLLRQSKRLGAGFVGAGLVVIWLGSTPLVAQWLLLRLERAYPPGSVAECRPAQAIVLLGGAVQPLVAGDLRGRLHRGSDRVWEAARLFHAGCAPLVVVSAGGLVEPPQRARETEAIAGLLLDLGIPAPSLVLEDESRNTQGNAASTRSLLEPLGIDEVLLVTSAWHLRRAVALFEAEGFAVSPVGADYRSFRACRRLQCWIPSPDALEASGLAVKEYLGYWIQVERRRASRGAAMPVRDAAGAGVRSLPLGSRVDDGPTPDRFRGGDPDEAFRQDR